MQRLSGNKYQTAHEYSLTHCISESLVRRYCRSGRLKATKIKNRWVILKTETVEGYEPRLKDGTYVGLNDLKRGDMDTFLKKRGISIY